MKTGAGFLLFLFFSVAGASPAPQEGAKKPAASARIDDWVRSIPGYNKKTESPLADDGEFLRRVMIDLVGYPPNADQAKTFAADANPNKRVQKIEELVESEPFAWLWARQFAEVFFGDSANFRIDQVQPQLGGDAPRRFAKDFLEWLKTKIVKDRPYTEIVEDILTASGKTENDPALAYKLSFYVGDGHAMEFASAIAKHFLGSA